MDTEKKIYTYADLKAFCNSLTEEQLKCRVIAIGEDSGDIIEGCELQDEDLYANVSDAEDCATLAELKELHGEDFVEADYRLVVPIGTPRMYKAF